MGITFITATVTGPSGKNEEVEFLVDGGASYSLLPNDVWKRLELEKNRTEEFALADGTIVSRDISECYFALEGAEGHSPVILGEPDDDQALLGVITLETLGLVLDPFNRRLRKMSLRL